MHARAPRVPHIPIAAGAAAVADVDAMSAVASPLVLLPERIEPILGPVRLLRAHGSVRRLAPVPCSAEKTRDSPHSIVVAAAAAVGGDAVEAHLPKHTHVCWCPQGNGSSSTRSWRPVNTFAHLQIVLPSGTTTRLLKQATMSVLNSLGRLRTSCAGAVRADS